MTVADLLLARADDDHPGFLFEDRAWSWRHVVDESLDSYLQRNLGYAKWTVEGFALFEVMVPP